MSSITSIANTALRLVGGTRIGSISDDTPNARLLFEAWPDARRQVLRSHNWKSATTRAKIAADSAVPAFQFSNMYILPAPPVAFMRLVSIGEDEFDSRAVFKIEVARSGDTGLLHRMILTDEGSPLAIKYVFDAADPSRMDEQLTGAIAARLAFEVAYKLTKSRGMAESMWTHYSRLLEEARFNDSTETPELQDPFVDVMEESRAGATTMDHLTAHRPFGV